MTTKDQDIISLSRIEKYRDSGDIGSNIEFHREIDSTNIRAKQLAAQGAAHGTVVLADSQSAGHGRFGRAFYSPKGSGVYISIILRPKLQADRAVLLTSLAAVAVARAIEKTADVRAEIKWVNDVYIGSKKVCGILCEAGMDFESGQPEYVVMGIGINVGFREFPRELENIATSVSNECGRAVSRDLLIAELLNAIAELYPQLDDGGFMAENRARSNVIGKNVFVLRGEERYGAKAVAIDDAGSLIVEKGDGTRETLHSGEISLKFA